MQRLSPIIFIFLASLFIALVTRSGMLQFSPNFSYIKIGSWQNITFGEFDTGGVPLDTPIYGQGGLPISIYQECKMSLMGTRGGTRCGQHGKLGEVTNLLNILFWFLVFFLSYHFFSKKL